MRVPIEHTERTQARKLTPRLLLCQVLSCSDVAVTPWRSCGPGLMKYISNEPATETELQGHQACLTSDNRKEAIKIGNPIGVFPELPSSYRAYLPLLSPSRARNTMVVGINKGKAIRHYHKLDKIRMRQSGIEDWHCDSLGPNLRMTPLGLRFSTVNMELIMVLILMMP